MNNLWLICNDCGFSAFIPSEELKEWKTCPSCKGRLVLDLSQGKKTILEDNLSILREEKINKKAFQEFTEIEQINKAIPIISRKDILEFIIDLNIKSTKELFNI